ncbi:hypothetical protein BTHERMOSOX_1464 [Bathymodiolus thermophilus thioautotrophic gill symbiont]|nr:hypothetical protein [Bathymodiolus thermophilus thioautotrophic gill symbiont]SHA11060.1 hypothetical protein BTHERMOSOX_1464 [Bathymodiolus thermophilus thioautotrophic gill symbiont]
MDCPFVIDFKEAVVITFSNRIGYLSCGSGTYIDNIGIYGYIFIDASACYLYAVRGMDKLSNKNMVIIKALHLDIKLTKGQLLFNTRA